MPVTTQASPAIRAEYTVVLRAPAAARFLPEEGQEVSLVTSKSANDTPLRLRMCTRWLDRGFDAPLPGDLWLEVRGVADSLDDAITRFAGLAQPFTSLLAFCANTKVGTAEVHLAYESTPGRAEREFLEVFLPDESGVPKERRIITISDFNPCVRAYLSLTTELPRIMRALQQYNLALRYWYFGGEWLALAHLYMAVETLTPSTQRKVETERGLTTEELARSVGVDPDDPSRPRWRPALEKWCRREVIFAGDHEVYRQAKSASDGIGTRLHGDQRGPPSGERECLEEVPPCTSRRNRGLRT